MNSTISLIKVIQKNIYDVISDLSGYQVLKKKFSNTEENNEIKENKQENNIEEAKKFQRKETITKPNIKKNMEVEDDDEEKDSDKEIKKKRVASKKKEKDNLKQEIKIREIEQANLNNEIKNAQYFCIFFCYFPIFIFY